MRSVKGVVVGTLVAELTGVVVEASGGEAIRLIGSAVKGGSGLVPVGVCGLLRLAVSSSPLE